MKIFQKYKVTNTIEITKLIEELKQKLQVKAQRMRRYKKRKNQYIQNNHNMNPENLHLRCSAFFPFSELERRRHTFVVLLRVRSGNFRISSVKFHNVLCERLIFLLLPFTRPQKRYMSAIAVNKHSFSRNTRHKFISFHFQRRYSYIILRHCNIVIGYHY
jgi:hypothetical protein